MKKKPDPVIEKLDEILKTLKRIEAKPAQPYFVAPYYQPVYIPAPQPVYPTWPQFMWQAPAITVIGAEATPANNQTWSANNVSGATYTLTAGGN